VNENLAAKFMGEVQIPEARYFYSTQIFVESMFSIYEPISQPTNKLTVIHSLIHIFRYS